MPIARGIALVAACATAASCAAHASHVTPVRVAPPSAFPSSTASDFLVFARAPFEQTVRLVPGQRLDVSLPAGMDPLGVDDPTVLATESTSGGYPSEVPLAARLVGLRRGETRVATVTDATCFHTTPACTYPQGQVTLRVVVR